MHPLRKGLSQSSQERVVSLAEHKREENLSEKLFDHYA